MAFVISVKMNTKHRLDYGNIRINVKNILNSPENKFQLQTAAGLIQINILENKVKVLAEMLTLLS